MNAIAQILSGPLGWIAVFVVAGVVCYFVIKYLFPNAGALAGGPGYDPVGGYLQQTEGGSWVAATINVLAAPFVLIGIGFNALFGPHAVGVDVNGNPLSGVTSGTNPDGSFYAWPSP